MGLAQAAEAAAKKQSTVSQPINPSDQQSLGSTPASSVLTPGTSYGGNTYTPNSYGTNQPTVPSVMAFDGSAGYATPSASQYSSSSSFTPVDPQAQPGHYGGYSQYPPSFQGYEQGNQQPPHQGDQPGAGAGYQQQYSQYGHHQWGGFQQQQQPPQYNDWEQHGGQAGPYHQPPQDAAPPAHLWSFSTAEQTEHEKLFFMTAAQKAAYRAQKGAEGYSNAGPQGGSSHSPSSYGGL
ncbi:hypothetical protein FFLO_04855 [Filobasidium floriforme]|uniref:Uncharacterized protein n=1 Tax=Filobasidium floriforme TaxID=5210 RepID=A0A8K0NNT9_9TREE|nr:uncharacterized protein HD553DRAFT_365699 [Filobasidium floriforme]KAG7530685.1 hypothetical protein FFLO_04855 [Filobasidium floriforme]KAH8077814.1 hypothetical protein HD553DRAFT_365699 [Filobasidium floriforme]